MTRKDYIKIAEVLNKHRVHINAENLDQSHFDDFALLVADISNIFINDNPKFDNQKFYAKVYGYEKDGGK